MTRILQGAFLVATVLTFTAAVISARQLLGVSRGRAQREFPTRVAVRGAALFAVSMYSMAAVVGRLGDRLGDTDSLLYAAVFGLAAGALTYLAQTPEEQTPDEQHRRPLSQALLVLAFALPIASGLIAGLVGPV